MIDIISKWHILIQLAHTCCQQDICPGDFFLKSYVKNGHKHCNKDMLTLLV